MCNNLRYVVYLIYGSLLMVAIGCHKAPEKITAVHINGSTYFVSSVPDTAALSSVPDTATMNLAMTSVPDTPGFSPAKVDCTGYPDTLKFTKIY